MTTTPCGACQGLTGQGGHTPPHDDRESGAFRRIGVDGMRTDGLIGSMGRVSSAGDNAAMESFFALLQKNVLNRR